ncbi:hypothetical protein [Mycobacterium antarcticum]|uniref:hypothetical protein n=1 Tax=Mycolicibacterium sp. TUM20983 TaxID=3023369 RepID=UPI0024E088DE|nr:hypothetical protein [Mycolicibacterium sp. TUM20983]
MPPTQFIMWIGDDGAAGDPEVVGTGGGGETWAADARGAVVKVPIVSAVTATAMPNFRI